MQLAKLPAVPSGAPVECTVTLRDGQPTKATVEPAAVASRGKSRTQEPHGGRREGGLRV